MGHIVLISTFVLFTTEALLHYNIGKNADSKSYHIYCPSLHEFFKICLVVFIFSVLNTIIVNFLSKRKFL